MAHTRTSFRYFSGIILGLFISNTIAPTLQYTFAVSTQYYVDAISGNDANDGISAPWQTIAKVNASNFLQGDSVSLRCGDTWNEDLILNDNGGVGAPIIFNSYASGAVCDGTNKPIIQTISANTVSDVQLTGLSVSANVLGSAINLSNSTNVEISNSDITNVSGSCMDSVTSAGLLVNSNTFSNCTYAFSGSDVGIDITNNTFSGMTENAVSVLSSQSVNINDNTFSFLQKGAIVFGQSTTVLRNNISSVCQGSSLGCSAIRNEEYSPIGSVYSAEISSNFIKDVGSGISGNNYGISIKNINGSIIGFSGPNTVNNAEEALHIEDAKNLNISSNNFLFSRARGVQVIQNTAGAVSGNTFTSNTLLQKNPDYPYIEMRDEVAGGSMASMLNPSSNNFYTVYKPNTSYVRSVKFGGETIEYPKSALANFDPSVTKFEYFAYKPYTNTGSYATVNLLSNPDFDTDATLWTPSVLAGGAPSIAHNISGSYIGGSATVTPAGGSADRLWLTNNAILTISAGQTYLVTGYAKSGSGNINLRGFMHKVGDMNTVYSDRIAETYASSTGGTFSFYLTANTGASDAQFSLETSNQDVAYEIDAISLRRMNAVVKNSSTTEVLVFSNPTATPVDLPFPGSPSYLMYVDSTNVRNSSSTINIPGYQTAVRFWDNNGNPHPNILSVPTCSFLLSPGGSLPTGQPLTATWIATGSLSQIIDYTTYTGSIAADVSSSGSVTYIPAYNGVSSVTLHPLNDVGLGYCNSDITTNNLPPSQIIVSYTGTEGDSQINATLSGTDPNPGDTVSFELISATTTNGFPLVMDFSGNVQYFPGADFCGTDSFDFRVYDQFLHYSDWLQPGQPLQTINVQCVNDSPVLNASGLSKTASGYISTPVPIDIIENTDFHDVDSSYVTQSFSLNYTQPTNGSVISTGTPQSPQFQYTSNPSFSGTDSFQYSILDQSGGLSATGTVNVTIVRFNNLPTITDSGYTINEDSPLSGTLTGTDLDGDPITFTGTSASSGTLIINSDGTFTYTPDANIFGTDSFTYRAYDGIAYSTPATINITINPVPDAPIAVGDSIGVIQDTTQFLAVQANDSDVDSTVLSLTGYTNPSHGTIITAGGGGGGGEGFSYTPTPGYSGSDSFTYQLIDDTSLLSNVVTVNLTIAAVNYPPTATGASYSFNEDATLNGTLSASDPEGSTLTYIIDVAPIFGTLSPVSSTGSFTYTPPANYNGAESFIFHVNDGVQDSSGVTVDLTINPINDAPVATPASFSVSGNIPTNSGNVLNGNLSGTDVEGSPLSFSATTLPSNGTFSMTSTGAFTYTPALGYSGSTSFTFVVNDGLIDSTGATVNITVSPVGVNNAPVATPASFSVSGNIPTNSGNVLNGNLSGTDVEGSPLSFSATTLPSNGTFSMTSTGAFTYTPALGYSGSTSFTFVVNDGLIDSTGATVNITVTVNGIVVIPPPTIIVGPGGGGGGAGSASYPSTSLYSQLLGGKITDVTFNSAPSTNAIGSIINTVSTMVFDNQDGPIILRQIIHLFVAETDSSSNPVDAYSGALEKIRNIPVENGSRMQKTKKYAMRILVRNMKIYEDIVYRDALAKSNSSSSSSSSSSDGSNNSSDLLSQLGDLLK